MSNDKSNTTVNYTVEQEAAIKAASPLNLESAKVLGDSMGKGYRSIIAKCLSMKASGADCDYISKPPPAKREAVETKAEIVADIAKALGVSLDGLDKATVKALCTLRSATVPAFALTQAEKNEVETANS